MLPYLEHSRPRAVRQGYRWEISNTFVAATAEMPFGGVKHSGFGRENGSQGIADYLDTKFINVELPGEL